jgi:hypothetical protein
MRRGWLNVPFVVWAGICIAIAIVYVWIWPSESVSANTSALRFFFIRWGHSIAWVLLGLMCVMKATEHPHMQTWSSRVGLGALPFYIGFLFSSYV